MRDLLRERADRGGTVLLSSHLLHEVEAVADRLVMIVNGRVRAAGPKDELLAAADGVVVRSSDRVALEGALRGAGIAWTPSTDGALIARTEPAAVGLAAAGAGVALTELRAAGAGRLEELFLSLTREGAVPAGPGTVREEVAAR